MHEAGRIEEYNSLYYMRKVGRSQCPVFTNMILKESQARHHSSLTFYWNCIIIVTRAERSYSLMEYSKIYINLTGKYFKWTHVIQST